MCVGQSGQQVGVAQQQGYRLRQLHSQGLRVPHMLAGKGLTFGLISIWNSLPDSVVDASTVRPTAFNPLMHKVAKTVT